MVSIRVDSGKVQRNLSQLLGAYASRVEEKVDEVIRNQAGELRTDIIKGWPVDTFASRLGWQGPTKLGNAIYQLKNEYVYAPTIEFGGYPGVGPKTARLGGFLLPGGIEVGGGIFPTQRPAAPVRQALSKRIVALRQALEDALS